MAIAAGGGFQLPTLVPRNMALVAGNRDMFADKRILCPAVIEFRLVRHAPTVGRVAVLAVIAELSFVDIGMAVGAKSKAQTGELRKAGVGRHLMVDNLPMTLGAQHLRMFTGKHEFGASVVEPARRFPSGGSMALGAGGGELSAVFIGVAIGAGRPKPEEGAIAIGFVCQKRSRIGQECHLVTLATIKTGVLAVERVSGLAMVK